LIALTLLENNITCLKPGKGTIGKHTYFTREAQKLNGLKQSILLLYAISGCDTVSCFFYVGKLKNFKLLKKYPDLQNVIDIFNNPHSLPDEILKSGEQYILKLYGSLEERSIYNYHYFFFIRNASKTKFNLAGIPLKQEALKQHLFRMYHQVQTWYGRKINA